MKNVLLPFFLLCLTVPVFAQPFTKITDPGNPIFSDTPETYYQGASWIDYDNDGLLDLFVVRKGLYHNDGNGNFSKISNSGITTTAGLGNSWADYDNDGDLDCFISAGNNRGSSLFTNNGSGSFVRSLAGPLEDSLALRVWSCTWGDYDNDGYADIVLAAPYNFIGITDNNKLLHNKGDGTFERIDTSIICQGPGAYTIASWSDYNDDGDIDLFIGSGPVNGVLLPDYLYKNLLKETNESYFATITDAPLTEPRDGQQWSWIDFDNDRDLDGFVTNYTGLNVSDGYVNEFYRNDNGTFVKLTFADVGTIVTDMHISLANIWEDFDNDADLDCLVINDAGQSNVYYQNNLDAGSVVFSKIATLPFLATDNPNFSGTAGDYDNDGDLDLFISSSGSAKGLYRNDQANGNSWINLKLTGTNSNRSALNAKVMIKATISGSEVWQMREVSSQSSFNGMNSLNVEFGFGDADIIDSIIIIWPSGITDQYTGVEVNQFYNATEQESLTVGFSDPSFENTAPTLEVHPNPASTYCRVRTVPPTTRYCTLNIYDQFGNRVEQLYQGLLSKGIHDFDWHTDQVAAGIYTCRLITENFHSSAKILVIK